MRKLKLIRRIPAFTIAELVIVMILSLILVGVALSAYQIINAQYLNYERDSQKVLEVNTLKSLLYRDIDKSKMMYLESLDLSLEFPAFNLIYEFDPRYIVRKTTIAGTRNDTFFVSNSSFQASFEENGVNAGLIDYLELEIELNEQIEKLMFQKDYSAAQLLRNNPQN